MYSNRVLSIVTLQLIFLLFLTASPTMAASEAGASPQVQIDRATPSLNYPGLIMANREAQLAFRISGPIIKVVVQPGEFVKKGQVLMEIDPRDFKDNIRVLEAQLAGSRAQKKRAERDFGRARTLFEQKVSATADFDRAQSVFDSAAASVQIVQAQLQIARHRLKDTTLRAPYAGVITTQKAENFEMVRAGQVVIAIQDIARLEVEIKVPEYTVAQHQLNRGQTVSVELPALAGRRFSAQLKEWNSTADPITRTYALRFSFPAPDDVQILPGMTAEVYVSQPIDSTTGKQGKRQ